MHSPLRISCPLLRESDREILLGVVVVEIYRSSYLSWGRLMSIETFEITGILLP